MFSDPAACEFILHLDKEHHFVIARLDETHLFIDMMWKDKIQRQVNELIERSTYKKGFQSSDL